MQANTKKEKKEIQKKFGNRVKQLREEKKLSKIALADLLGIDRQQIQEVERGERNPTLFTIIKLSEALGVSVCSLLEFYDKEKKGKR